MAQNDKNAKLIALAATLILAALTFFCLLTVTIGWDKQAITEKTIQAPEEEEIFIDAELLEHGDEDIFDIDEPAPAPEGSPEQADEPQDKLVATGENPMPSSPQEKLTSQKQDSPVKSTEPPKTQKEESKISSTMKDKFSSSNGKTDGKPAGTGTGGSGIGTAGSLNGRTFLGCAEPSVAVSKEVKIVVNVTVDASGKVTEASFKSDSGPGQGNTTLRNACVQASKNARWSKKEGARPARGTITWTLKPRS